MYSLNELKKGSGPSLYERAKLLIPGGTQLLSKRPEMFAPDIWPSYYSKAKGCNVWDLDGRQYLDMSIMAVGACILGYADDEVDDAPAPVAVAAAAPVKKVVKKAAPSEVAPTETEVPVAGDATVVKKRVVKKAA
jgi:glutamate-1-semialdehyde aminotransferase